MMKKIMPAGPVFQAGTLSGNPVAMAAGIATLTELKTNPPYERLETTSAKLEAGITAAAKKFKIPHCYNRVGSMGTLFFTDKPVTDLAGAQTSDTDLFARFFWAMMDRGVYLPCSQFEAAFTCAALTDAEVEKVIVAASESLESIAK